MTDKHKCATCYCELDKKQRLCERCRNKRVIEWVSVKDKLPEKPAKYLCLVHFDGTNFYRDKWFNGEEFSTTESSCITHWADISRLAPSDGI